MKKKFFLFPCVLSLVLCVFTGFVFPAVPVYALDVGSLIKDSSTIFGGFIERSASCSCMAWDDIPFPNPWTPPYDNEGMKYKGRLIHVNEPTNGQILIIYKAPMGWIPLVGSLLEYIFATKVYRHGRRPLVVGGITIPFITISTDTTHRVGHWVLGRNLPFLKIPCRDTSKWRTALANGGLALTCFLGGECSRPPVRICGGLKGGGGELSRGFPGIIIGSGLEPDSDLPATSCNWSFDGYSCF